MVQVLVASTHAFFEKSITTRTSASGPWYPPPLSEFVGKSSPLPSVCVPDVIGALVCGFQTQKIQKTPVSLSQALLGYLVTSPPSGCAPALSVWIQPPPKKKRLYTLVCVPDVFGWLTV